MQRETGPHHAYKFQRVRKRDKSVCGREITEEKLKERIYFRLKN